MISEEATLTQNKILGVLLRKARLDAHKTVEDCAKALGCDPAYVARAEEGAEALSLPQVESLSHVLDVPLSYFLTPEMPENEPESEPIPYQELMLVRRRIIGVILRQARQEAGLTLADLAPDLGYTPEQLGRVELGEAEISLTQLQALSAMLGIGMDAFTVQSVMPAASAEPGAVAGSVVLDHLPPEIQEFIFKPINTPYLQIAMNLSEMPAETLRQIASGLLEITY